MKKIFLHPIIVCTVLCVVLLLNACKTTKNTAMYRGWHNMNARFNGYFYSNEAMKESLVKVTKANTDDFTTILPLFVYPTNANAKNFFADFDKSIKKSSTVIHRHCITDKRKKEIPNACKWIDENYILIGRAHLYKRDLFSALEAFEYVSKVYKEPKAKYSGMLWMIRANNEIGSYSLSEAIIDKLRNAKDFPKDIEFQRDLALGAADFYLRRADYSPAAKELIKSITLTKKKKDRARATYILAQLYEQAGNKKQARIYYNQVPRLHPPYEMVFNAQIRSAMLFDAKEDDSRLVKKQLVKMLKDIKNEDYKDQIYFALAEISLQDSDTTGGISYLGNSIAASKANVKQKALSYLKRADVYFEQTDYKKAQANYDSTIAILPKDFPNYTAIEDKKKNLTELVINLNIIAREDSLLTLARMSETERNAAIDKMIAQAEEAEKKKQEEKENQENNAQQDNITKPGGAPGGNTGAWYFYNPTTVSFGVAEFNKKWGNRKLEDNWRRTDKEMVVVSTQPETNTDNGTGNDSTSANGANEKADGKGKNKKNSRDAYLKNIPLTADAQDKSTLKIIDAYYNAGSIYKEQLSNNRKSSEMFEEMLHRFPDNKHKLSVYYQLYRTYTALENKPKAEYYKSLILRDYANTEYAKIIGNPEYAKEAAGKKSEVERFYTETYQLYSEAKYADALANCNYAENTFGKNDYMSQFFFLKALCIGRTQDIGAFESALNQVVIKYPKAAVREKAQDILDAIQKQKGTSKSETKADSTKNQQKFVFKEDGPYYWVTVVENGKGDINNFKVKLSDANADSFSADNLEVSSIFLDLTHQLVSVKTFTGKQKAMVYYNFFKDDQQFFMDLNEGSYQTFLISAENYTLFYKDKNIEEYQAFFTQYFK